MREHLKIAMVLGCAALLGGCTTYLRSPGERRTMGMVVAGRGGDWEAVLPGPIVATELADARGPEYDRRDASLSYRPNDAVTAMDSWPARPQPSLSRWRTLRLPRDADEVLFFEQQQGTRDGYGRPGNPYCPPYNSPRYDRYWHGGQY